MQVNASSLEKTLNVYEIKQTARILKLLNSSPGISMTVFVCILLDFFFFTIIYVNICNHLLKLFFVTWFLTDVTYLFSQPRGQICKLFKDYK